MSAALSSWSSECKEEGLTAEEERGRGGKGRKQDCTKRKSKSRRGRMGREGKLSRG